MTETSDGPVFDWAYSSYIEKKLHLNTHIWNSAISLVQSFDGLHLEQKFIWLRQPTFFSELEGERNKDLYGDPKHAQ